MLTNINAIIIGGLGGIGSAISKKLLDENINKLAILDIQDSVSTEFQNKLNVKYVKCSIENRHEMKNVFENIWNEFDGFELVINSAGIVNERNPEKCFNINALGAINCVTVASEFMRKDKNGRGGTIVNIASDLGYLSYKGFPIYSASKHAVLGFMKSIGDPKFCEITGLRFVTICPGYTDTNFIEGVQINELAFEAQPETLPPQSPTVVADCVLKSLKSNKISSFWKCKNGEISEIELLTAKDIQ
uniref:CSON009007 protein n=1 Tax=Culicoides sonorensis TaxID=179676 RepID=A0A336LCY8_CULSO